MQGRSTFIVPGLHVGTNLKKVVHYLKITVLASNKKWCQTIVVPLLEHPTVRTVLFVPGPAQQQCDNIQAGF